MRVVLADPPAYTPPYDRSLAAALARARGRRRARHVALPLRIGRRRRSGYEAREWFYPLSSRLNGHRLRLAVKALEHPLGMARFAPCEARRDPRPVARRARGRPLALPPAQPGRASPPTTSSRGERCPRRRCGGRSSSASTGSSCTRSAGEGSSSTSASPPRSSASSRTRSSAPTSQRADDGRTALCLGLIRPYKGTEDAVKTVLGVDGARLLVVGDPRVPLDGLRSAAGRPRRVATRIPPGRGAAPRPLGGDRRALSLPRRDRRLRSAAAGARGRRSRHRLRHRRARRGRRPLRRGRGRAARRRRVHVRGAPATPRRRGCTRRRRDAGPSTRARSSPGTPPLPQHLELYREIA